MTRRWIRIEKIIFFCAFVLVVSFGCSEKKSEPTPEQTWCDWGFCRDCDCDTICDQDEGAVAGSTCDHPTGEERDTDKDGIPDYLDTDSDGDGVPDIVEAGDSDPGSIPGQYGPGSVGWGYLDPNVPNPRDAGSFDAAIADVSVDSAPLELQDGQGVYEPADAETVDIDSCVPIPVHCLDDIEEGDVGLCDGLDNDCDGVVDESCDCEVPGRIQSCFLGPPDLRNQGACRDGIQVCRMMAEFTYRWGPCEDSISPSEEVCDKLDNDCNGCIDEIPDCKPAGECPGPDDPRIPDAQPFTSYSLNGEDFYYDDNAVAWHWEVTGSPCDRLFQSIDSRATSSSGDLSYKLEGEDQRDATVSFSLSGSYHVHLTVTRDDQTEFSCNWVMSVRASGLRVELCWDKTGRVATQNGDGVDLDLHLGKTRETTAWFSDSDCYQRTCRGNDTPWSYDNTTDLAACTGVNAPNYQAYHDILNYCPNPRLDIDNKNMSATAYVAENINIDNPQKGDEFRVMVEYYTNIQADAVTDPDSGVPLPTIETHPLINVYCGGTLQGSFGGVPDPNEGDDSQFIPLQGFDTPGEIWRVVDIQIQSSATASCALTPIYSPDLKSLYFVSEHDDTYP
jgi:hypothetical protein